MRVDRAVPTPGLLLGAGRPAGVLRFCSASLFKAEMLHVKSKPINNLQFLLCHFQTCSDFSAAPSGGTEGVTHLSHVCSVSLTPVQPLWYCGVQIPAAGSTSGGQTETRRAEMKVDEHARVSTYIWPCCAWITKTRWRHRPWDLWAGLCFPLSAELLSNLLIVIVNRQFACLSPVRGLIGPHENMLKYAGWKLWNRSAPVFSASCN